VDRYDGFEQWAAARSPALSRSAYLLTGEASAAEDLVQEALIAAARVWPRIADDPEPYVRRVLYTKSVDRWRRRPRLEVLVEPPASATSVDDRQVEVTRAVTLQRALAKLTPRQRAVLVLRYFEDLTEVQAAHVLGCSQSTVKSQTRDALDRLRSLAPALLADHDDAEVSR
jgi:RNA polymerase sigma-70 factor (sigma-E family)